MSKSYQGEALPDLSGLLGKLEPDRFGLKLGQLLQEATEASRIEPIIGPASRPYRLDQTRLTQNLEVVADGRC